MQGEERRESLFLFFFDVEEARKKVYVFVDGLGHKTWAGRVKVHPNYVSRGATIKDTESRAITLIQVNDLAAFILRVLKQVEIEQTNKYSPLYGKYVGWDTLTMYDVCELFVKPLTEPHTCSFVDLGAEAPQPPKWFVSHAWSTPFSQTVWRLNFHSTRHDLPLTTNYWICTFANNQHDLGPRLGTRGGWVKKTSRDVIIHFPKDDNLGY